MVKGSVSGKGFLHFLVLKLLSYFIRKSPELNSGLLFAPIKIINAIWEIMCAKILCIPKMQVRAFNF